MGSSDEAVTVKLSIVLNLKDKYTGKQPIGRIKVSLKDAKYKAVKNPSGYYLFLNVSPSEYFVKVESDNYINIDDQKAVFAIFDPAKSMDELTQEILLDPNPAYPFPNGTTLLRGKITDNQGNPLSNASVELVERNLETKTDEKGWYVFFFPPLVFTAKDAETDKTSDIIIKNDKRIVKAKKTGKSTTFTIKATSNDLTLSGNTKLYSDVEEGTCVTVPAIALNITS